MNKAAKLAGWLLSLIVGGAMGQFAWNLFAANYGAVLGIFEPLETYQILGLAIGSAGSLVTIWWTRKHPFGFGYFRTMNLPGAYMGAVMGAGSASLMTFIAAFFIFPGIASTISPATLAHSQIAQITFMTQSGVLLMSAMFAWVAGLLVYLLYAWFS